MKNILLFVIYFVCSVGGATIYKLGSGTVSVSIVDKMCSIKFGIIPVFGLSLYVFSFLLWLMILKNNDISTIAPLLSGISVMLMTLSGVFIFGENLTPVKIIGIVVTVIGLFLIQR